MAGHSSGGPYAVACAALLPERVFAGVVVAGVTDMDWPGAWDGYPEDEIQIMHAPGETAAIAWCTKRYGADGSGLLEAEPFEFPEPDLVLLDDETFESALIEAFRQGVTGYAQDVYVRMLKMCTFKVARGPLIRVASLSQWRSSMASRIPCSQSRTVAIRPS